MASLGMGLIGTGYMGKCHALALNNVATMDEDFMADPDAPFSPRSKRVSGYGALDDFAVHAPCRSCGTCPAMRKA